MYETEKWMTVGDLSNYLQISKEKIYLLARNKKIPAYRIGSYWRFKRDLIDKWIKKKQKV